MATKEIMFTAYFNRHAVSNPEETLTIHELIAEEWDATFEEIKAGEAGSLTFVEYEGREFVIAYVL